MCILSKFLYLKKTNWGLVPDSAVVRKMAPHIDNRSAL
jgi:hypothetical protein